MRGALLIATLTFALFPVLVPPAKPASSQPAKPQATQPATKPVDDYADYVDRSTKVIKAFEGLDKMLAEKLPNADDYVKAMHDTLPAWTAWGDGLTEDQREYPSAESLKLAGKTYKKVALSIAFTELMPQPKPGDDADVALALNDAILKAKVGTLDLRDEAKDATAKARKLIRSREGTRPVLPKRPPE